LIKYEIRATDITLKYLEEMPDKLVKRVHECIGVWALNVQRAVLSKVGGGLLKSRSGKLYAAIARGTRTVHEPARGRIVGIVGLKNADKGTYIAAGANEYGASIAARVIEARDRRALKFQVGNSNVFAARVQLPNITVPERSFMRSSLEQMKPQIIAAIDKAANLEDKVV
jgi:hypothetical protein